MSATIADIEPDVTFALGGRAGLQAKVHKWLRNAYIEIGSNIPLETLEGTGQDLTIAGIDAYDYPATARAIKNLTLVFSNGSTCKVTKKSIQVIDNYPGPLSDITGTPTIWASFGSQFFLRPVPNDSYILLERFWVKPAIADPVETTELLVPDDWLEVLIYAATLRGHIDLCERDKAHDLQVLLHGDPKHPDKNPGLIKTKLRKSEAEAGQNGFAIVPKVRSYT